MDQNFLKHLHDLSLPLKTAKDLDPLLSQIGDSRIVLLGEASHGTHEYYDWRAEISKRLIQEKSFSFIAVEGDWPDCYRINRYAKGFKNSGKSVHEVLYAFKRWPTWMWANWEIVELVRWLKKFNQGLPEGEEVGFYGLDVYSLWESMYALIEYLRKTKADAIDQAIKAYECFEPYKEDPQEYARAQAFVPSSCADEVVDLLAKVIQSQPKFSEDGVEGEFNAQQNAFVLMNAENYYRQMVYGGANTWNLRDEHMTDTLDRLMEFYGKEAKGIIWAHNTHIGDARFTDMVQAGEYNIGQLVRERHQREGAVAVGFGSYSGTVVAGKYWGAPMEIMKVPEAKKGSWEDIFHQSSADSKLILSPDLKDERFFDWRGQRAIGVVYNPDYELGNYVETVLPKRYDAFIYLDKTEALRPLHLKPKKEEIPETYPFGV